MSGITNPWRRGTPWPNILLIAFLVCAQTGESRPEEPTNGISKRDANSTFFTGAFHPDQADNIEVVESFGKAPIAIAPLADLAHMWLGLIRTLWSAKQENFTHLEFLDESIPGSTIEFAADDKSGLTTQELGWSGILALESTILGETFNLMTVPVAEAVIQHRNPRGRIGSFQPKIYDSLRNGTSASQSDDDPSSNSTTSKLRPRVLDTSSQNVTLASPSNKSPIEVHAVVTHETVPQRTILAAIEALLRGRIWQHSLQQPVAQLIAPGTSFAIRQDNCTLWATVGNLNQGTAVTFGHLEQAITELVLRVPVRWFPQTFEATAYLLGDQGLRPKSPYLTLKLILNQPTQSLVDGDSTA